jgi:hypothetical protein
MSVRTKIIAGSFALGALGLAVQASGGTTSQAIFGNQSAQENGCVDAIGIFTANDCSYNGINRWLANGPGSYNDPAISTLTEEDTTPPIQIDAYVFDRPDRTWIGPLANQMYYASGESPFSDGVFPATTFPAVGDNKSALGFSGQITIDDNGTPDGSDDLISGVIVIEAGTRNVLTGQVDGSRVEESWSSLTQTLAPTQVDSATANAAGGFDYVIASRGMPEVLQPMGLNDQAYPSEIASSPIVTPIATPGWVAPDSQGRSVANFECTPEHPTQITARWDDRDFPRGQKVRVTNHLGADCADPSSNNVGATTTGVFTDHSCFRASGNVDNKDTCLANPAILGAPASFFTPAGTPGYENLLIALSTDASGHIVSSNAFYTHQYQVLQALFGFSTPYEAWDGGTLTMAGIVQDGSLRVRPSGGSPDINPKSGGGVSVVLYSNDNLDATQTTNVTFGPNMTGTSHSKLHSSDVDGDGVDDRTMHFAQKETGIACGDTTATLSGLTADGLPFTTSATINVVGCH